MHVENLNYYSQTLKHDLYLNRYGHASLPILVFPSSGGTHNEYYDFGMIDASRNFVEEGLVQFFTVSSVDDVTWLAQNKSQYEIGMHHERYDYAIVHEIVPFIKYIANFEDRIMVTGCSMGAYHALNIFLKHPEVFGKVVALSGVYDARFFVGDYHDQVIYHNSPSDYIWQQDDPWYLDQYRRSDIIVCTGLGAWEQDGLESFYKLQEAFAQKGIPAWFDVWGGDVAHDWPWWRVQMPYFLDKLLK